MNQIYKVIWNKVRQCYMVVSEYAKHQTKSCSTAKLFASKVAAKTVVAAGIMAAVSVSGVAFAGNAGVSTYATGDIVNGSINGINSDEAKFQHVYCQVQQGSDGNWYLVSASVPGVDGKDGSSASISTADLTNAAGEVIGTTVTVKNINGTTGEVTEQTFNVLNGEDGKDGKDGADGKDGIDGKDGKDGVDGKDGADGKDGIDGKDGKDGVDGKDGADGKDGIDGKDGKDGIDGKDGKDGVDGKDGEKGDKGDQGEQGIQGEKGDKGDAGASIKGGTYAVEAGSVTMDITNGEKVVITGLATFENVSAAANDVETSQTLGGSYDSTNNKITLTIEDRNKEGVGTEISLEGVATEEYVDSAINNITHVTLSNDSASVSNGSVVVTDTADATFTINNIASDSELKKEIQDRKDADDEIKEQINNISNSTNTQINKLHGEIDTVGALSAAMAGLHPRFQDGNKGEFAAAIGTYDGKQALALGGFYAPNQEVMFSIGAAIAEGGKKMGNLGINFALDRSKDRKNAPKDIVYTRKEVDAMLKLQSEQIAALMAEVKALKASK